MRTQSENEGFGFLAGYSGYVDYVKLKLHFNSLTFVWKKEKEYKISQQVFLKRRDRPFFVKMEQQFKRRDVAIEYMTSGFLINKSFWIGDLLQSEDVYKYHNDRMKRINSLHHTFEGDLIQLSFWLNENGMCFEDCLLTNVEKTPIIIMLMGTEINKETVVLLSLLDDFIDSWEPISPLLIDRRHQLIKYRHLLNLRDVNRIKLEAILKTSVNHVIK